jgi:hypothetical protein
LGDHVIRPLHLPISARVSDRGPVDPDPICVGELQELLPCEFGPVVCDDGVWNTKLVDDVQEELDGLLGVSFGDGFHLNPLGELVHHDKQVSETTSGLLERPDHIKPPNREWPGERDGLKRLR